MAESWLRSTDFIWCPGCLNIWLAATLGNIFEDLGLDQKNTWLVSGIGCAGRMANYFNCQTAHTTHGRAIPVAEGIKKASPGNDVFVVSGDGDLLSIGLSHLIHTARRNTSLKVICVNNQVYAMTGGQTAPTTPKEGKTKTSPSGVELAEISAERVLSAFPNVFYRLVEGPQKDIFTKVVKEAFEHPGFAFVEARTNCLIHPVKGVGK